MVWMTSALRHWQNVLPSLLPKSIKLQQRHTKVLKHSGLPVGVFPMDGLEDWQVDDRVECIESHECKHGCIFVKYRDEEDKVKIKKRGFRSWIIVSWLEGESYRKSLGKPIKPL